MNSKAWMLRNDGKLFQVKDVIHLDTPEQVLTSCPWIYNHTNNESLKNNILKYLSNYIKVGDNEKLFSQLEEKKRIELEEFIKQHKSFISNAASTVVTEFHIQVDTNQEFLRISSDSMFSNYGLIDRTGDVIIEVSSVHFNWFNLIWQFLIENKMKYKFNTVTIKRYKDEVYAVAGKRLDHVDVDEVTSLQILNPVIE